MLPKSAISRIAADNERCGATAWRRRIQSVTVLPALSRISFSRLAIARAQPSIFASLRTTARSHSRRPKAATGSPAVTMERRMEPLLLARRMASFSANFRAGPEVAAQKETALVWFSQASPHRTASAVSKMLPRQQSASRNPRRWRQCFSAWPNAPVDGRLSAEVFVEMRPILLQISTIIQNRESATS